MKAAIYVRVSKTSEDLQNPENQIVPLENLAEALGMEICEIYVDRTTGSTSNRPSFQRMMKDAFAMKFDVILIWSLDRFSREGILQTLNYIETLNNYGIRLKSLQDSWLDTKDQSTVNLMLAILSWVAKQERERIIERTNAGLERARKQGKKLGRPKGSKDKKKRKKRGYFERYDKKRGR